MTQRNVIEAAKIGDLTALVTALANGADVNERDDSGWTALCWAAGKGDVSVVTALLEGGADVTAVGRDQRTPLMIAKAASRTDAAAALTAAEKERGVWQDPLASCQYCKAYALRDLRAFDRWREPAGDGAAASLTDDDVVYVHQDFSVTRSMWHGEDVLFDEATPEWKAFCGSRLALAIPADVL